MQQSVYRKQIGLMLLTAGLISGCASMFSGTGGSFMLGSILLSLAGIGICGWAASMKEKDLSSQTTKSDFDLKKGLLVAIVAGVMSACFSFGESTGKAMADLTASMNPGTIWKYNGVGSDREPWYILYTFSDTDFEINAQPPLPIKGKYKVVKELENLLLLEFYDLKSESTTYQHPQHLEVSIDRRDNQITIDGRTYSRASSV